jgi:pyruvate,water dikinase
MIGIEHVLDRSQYGGKAHRLSVLRSLGVSVPLTYVFSVDDVDSLREQGVDQDTLKTITESLCSAGGSVAVRSSAEDEDGERSWAGQFETCLFVEASEIERALLTCSQATESDAVRAYAEQSGVSVPRLALIVQKMVDARMAGVLFTRHPTSNKNVMVIEAIAGVGEDLVSGEREPRRYEIDRTSGVTVAVSGASEPEIPESILQELHRVGIHLVEHFGCDQDIEWALDTTTETLQILQCRDITVEVDTTDQIRERAIGQVQEALSAEFDRLSDLGYEGKDVLSDQNIAELLTPHPCVMAMGLFNYGFAHGMGGIRTGRNEMGYAIGEELDTGFFTLVSGQPRCSIVHDALTYRIAGIPLEDYWRIVGVYLDQIREDPSFANYPEISLYKQDPSIEFLAELFGPEKARVYRDAFDRFFAGFREIEDTLDYECRKTFGEGWRKKLEVLEVAHKSDELSELAAAYRMAADALRTDGCRMFVKAARVGFFAFARLRNLLKHLFGDKADGYLSTLTSGIDPQFNPNMQFNLDLARLRDGQIGLAQVVQRFGHLGYHELEISHPRYGDDPQLILELAQRLEGDPAKGYADQAEASEKLRQRLRSELVGEVAEQFDREVDLCRRYLPLREMVKFEYLRAYAILRRVAMKMGRVVGWEEALVFHLNPEEAFRFDSDHSQLHAIALQRRVEWNENRQLFTPQVIWSDETDVIGNPPEFSDDGCLEGLGVTNFVTEGVVVVMKNPGDVEVREHLRAGVVLVTVTTDPAWSPILSIIGSQGALVTEVGGLLAHGAIYAREMGIAAVLNVPGATSILRTGMRVRVHGPQGIVEILD